MIFVDTNVVIDVVDPRQAWHRRSRELIADRAPDGFAINHVVMAELHAGPNGPALFDKWRAGLRMQVVAFSDDAARAAGAAYGLYRARGGRGPVLADFLIGGHCVVLGATLITRDRSRFASYFPSLTIISPEESNV